MICFEVFVNGKRMCIAGVGDSGVLTAHVTWVKRRESDRSIEKADNDGQIESLETVIGGLAHVDQDHSQHLRWLYQTLTVGDEVMIRVANTLIPDQPIRRTIDFDGCSFCGKTSVEATNLMCGGRANICKKCTEVLSTQLSKDAEPNCKQDNDITGDLRCSFCGRSTMDEPSITTGKYGNICAICLNSAYEELHEPA